MKQHGRVSFITIASLLGVAIVLSLFFIKTDSPGQTAQKFMSALAMGDSKTLAQLSYMDGVPESEIEKKWEYTTQVAGKYYHFVWQIISESQASSDTASIKLDVVRNADSDSAYAERFGIPLVHQNGKWLVDVRSMSREMYPSLPR